MSKDGFEKVFSNLQRLAKKHDVAADIILDGSRAISVSLKNKGELLSVNVKINDIKKVLTTPELLKAGLSLLARKKGGQSRIEVNIDTGVFKKLFGKKS
ncbi:MAG: hypothetical protein ABIF85_01385 [Nanoarchaeota archaeon]|nr:hypothetical protein [Nanoarchaeota archaeon]MBU4299769.1 hypothetical protein [Nanoarchaeota archaeon]MBU4452582.1 hypothetical protein [Nanoarchaeota archaeon]MCG2723548.1 hypothetical protein [archaeon]